MVVPAPKTSSSAVSSRPNPSSRNAETRDPMRRSFTGNPFSRPSINTNVRGLNPPNTPANTPSDTPRRNSMSQENIVISFREVEDKENGKDPNQKAAKLRSPAATKSTKNFMSPTISAASKFSASPKKKILVERNEPARTSFSLSDAKSHPMEAADQRPERVPIQKETEASFDSTITDEKFKEPMKYDTFPEAEIKLPLVYENELESSMEAVTGEADPVNVDPSFNISPRPPCAGLAPLDADPRMPPYDPKKNYLSPRPQFLHYKPNPRIELFLKVGKEGKQLEERFLLDSSSDTEVTEEAESENSEKEPENISSNDSVEEEEKIEDDDEELQSPELVPIGTNMPKGAIEAKGVLKPRLFTRSRLVALLLFMTVACFVFSATDSPVMLKDLSFPKVHAPSEIIEIAKASLDRLAHNLNLWSANSYMSELILTFRGMHKESPSQFSNLTGLIEDHLLDSFQLFDHKGLETEKKNEPIQVDRKGLETEKKNEPIQVKPKIENAAENLMLEECEDDQVIGDQRKDMEDTTETEDSDYEDEECCKVPAEEEIEKQDDATDQRKDMEDTTETEDSDYEDEECCKVPAEEEREKQDDATETEDSDCEDEEGSIVQAEEEIEKQDNLDDNVLAEDIEPIFKVVNITAQVAAIERYVSAEEQTEERVETAPDSVSQHVTPSEDEAIRVEDGHENSEADVWMEIPQVSEKVDTLRYNFLLFDGLGYILLLLSLVTAKKFFDRMKEAYRSPNAEIRVGHAPVPNKMADDPKLVNVEYNFQEISSRIWHKEVETMGEECPSEMSSFQKSSSQNNEKRPTKSYQRESLSSSSDYSMGSPSYGSFTTYEKIPCKNGDGEEEIVTPVRRSSRLRKQVTSP